MKKILLVALCLSAYCLKAQPANHLRQDGHHINMVEQMATKNNFTHKLVAFRTSDNYWFNDFYYDWQNRLIAVHDSVRGDYSVTDSLSYNDMGQMVRLSGWQRFGTILKNVYYIDYTYDAEGNIASRTNYNFFDGEWNLGGVYNYTYNADHQMTRSELTMMNRIFQRVVYNYENGLLDSEVWYDYDFETSELAPSEKIVYSYENGRKVRECDSLYVGNNSWEYNGLRTYSYDNDGNCTEYHYYDNTRGEAERSVYSFNQDLPMNTVLMPWNPEMVRPNPVCYQNVLACEREEWHQVDVDHVLQYVCDYLYYYEEINNGISQLKTESLQVSPNPATDNVVVDGLLDEWAQVQLVDVTGRLVKTIMMNNVANTFSVQDLPAGCYLLRVCQQGTARVGKLVVHK